MASTPTAPATAIQALRDAKHNAAQAQRAYNAAADLLTKATTAKTQAESTMDEALSAKIAADVALEVAFYTYRDGPDDSAL